MRFYKNVCSIFLEQATRIVEFLLNTCCFIYKSKQKFMTDGINGSEVFVKINDIVRHLRLFKIKIIQDGLSA